MTRIPAARYVANFNPLLRHHSAWLQAVLEKLEKYEPDALQEGSELRKLWQNWGRQRNLEPLMALIKKGESGRAGYNAINRGRSNDTPNGLPGLTAMTIGQIKQDQKDGKLFAVGAYQLIPTTLAQLQAELSLSDGTVFNPVTQERIGIQLVTGRKRPRLAAYIRGTSQDLNGAWTDLALEWASIPGPNGKGMYDGDKAGNRATHDIEATRAALLQARGAMAR